MLKTLGLIVVMAATLLIVRAGANEVTKTCYLPCCWDVPKGTKCVSCRIGAVEYSKSNCSHCYPCPGKGTCCDPCE